MYLLQEIKCLQSCRKPKEAGLRLHLGIIPRTPSRNQTVKETAILGQLERWHPVVGNRPKKWYPTHVQVEDHLNTLRTKDGFLLLVD